MLLWPRTQVIAQLELWNERKSGRYEKKGESYGHSLNCPAPCHIRNSAQCNRRYHCASYELTL